MRLRSARLPIRQLPVTVATAGIAGLLTTGVAADVAGLTSGSSTVANVSVTLCALATLGLSP